MTDDIFVFSHDSVSRVRLCVFQDCDMFEHSPQPEGPGPLATSTLSDGVHGYHPSVSAVHHAKRRMREYGSSPPLSFY